MAAGTKEITKAKYLRTQHSAYIIPILKPQLKVLTNFHMLSPPTKQVV